MSDTKQSEDARLDALDTESLLSGTEDVTIMVCAPDLARSLIRERERTKALTAERDRLRSHDNAVSEELGSIAAMVCREPGHADGLSTREIVEKVIAERDGWKTACYAASRVARDNESERDSIREQVAAANNRARRYLLERDEARELVRLAADVEDAETLDAAFGKVNAAVARWDAEKAAQQN